jgi:alpha-tubulin suppressor-like RCC1 family protein
MRMNLTRKCNKSKAMKTYRATIWMCCLLALSQSRILNAAPSGYIVGWGNNIVGQAAGMPTSPFSSGSYMPSATGCVQFASQVVSNALAISAGSGHSLAITSDSEVIGWGGNSVGMALGYETPGANSTNGMVRINGQTLSNVVSVVASLRFSLALRKDGTILTWGENYVPEGLTSVTEIAAEWSYSWVLKSDGTIVGWASDPTSHHYGQLIPVINLSNVVAIAVGPGGYATRGVALKSDGTVGHWGAESDHKDATPPVTLSNVIAIAAGANHSLALKKDGTVVGWGFNNVGQATGVPVTDQAVSSGQVTIGGEVLSNVISISAGSGYSIALKGDGTVVTWGERMVNDLYPVGVPAGLSNVVAIAAGDNFCLTITTNRAVADKFRKSGE